MIFILLGVILLALKLSSVDPVSDWEWFSIAAPFLMAVCWFEVLEPILGLDVKRQRLRKLQFEERIRHFQNKKPRHSRQGFPFR